MGALFVWQLRFEDDGDLERAFHTLLEADDLDGCSAEPEELRIRFTASGARGEELVSKVYAMGALRWCSRHRLA
jgi:hypothetical protein